MTWIFWLFLLVVMVALAVATALRRKPAARISAAQRLPSPTDRDDNAGLGLSDVRAVPVGQAVPASSRSSADSAGGVRASARPAPAAAPPVAEPAGSEAWIDEVLEDVLSDEDETETQDAVLDVEPLDPATRAESAESPERDTRPDGLPDPAPAPEQAPDDTVWTFDAAAATPTPSTAAYVRPGQTLWPTSSDPAALLLASLASRLGGTAAVVRHEGPAYTVEMLAGARLGAEPAPMEAAGHPLHRVPQDNVLSLLGADAGAALTYHADPEAVGQALARTLAAPPAARVLVVVGVPPDAPDVDRETAALVDHYVALLADLTFIPTRAETDDEGGAWDEAWESAVATAGPEASFAVDDVDSELAEDADAAPDPAEDDVLTDEAAAPTRAGDTPRAVEAVAKPGAPRAPSPPPPRAVILNAEIDAARRDRRLLVFALVTLADSETVFSGGADGVVRAEAALRERLAAAPAVRRVEPFGDLVFGAFLDAEGPEVVRWAERISAAGRPLLVGAVPAMGEADAVREAAMDALQSAYERDVVCVVA